MIIVEQEGVDDNDQPMTALIAINPKYISRIGPVFMHDTNSNETLKGVCHIELVLGLQVEKMRVRHSMADVIQMIKKATE